MSVFDPDAGLTAVRSWARSTRLPGRESEAAALFNALDMHLGAGGAWPRDWSRDPRWPLFWSRHTNDAGDWCPWSLRPASVAPDVSGADARCPAGCRGSRATDFSDLED